MNQALDSFGPIGGYLPLVILISIAILLGLLLANLSRWTGPLRPNKIKESVYESGMDPVGTGHDRFSVKFYMVAMLFILFDIEIVFMYPWAVNFKTLSLMDTAGGGLFPFIEMFVFVVILFVGYIYVWKKGGLEWD